MILPIKRYLLDETCLPELDGIAIRRWIARAADCRLNAGYNRSFVLGHTGKGFFDFSSRGNINGVISGRAVSGYSAHNQN